ncbi:MAG: hypothetical protein A4E57_00434 [Syntrophorhabdaceae bacterium PtaU1.Bin034]|jgi:Cu/Ag efflux protein CusF|nr:MAG: hypothetical protein A4E57_00434 [Syntrophorhabdaceae bacterium PtaU1.Bin034]
MKRSFVVVFLLVAACVLSSGFAYSVTDQTMSATGKVTAVDPEGKAIVIDVGKGSDAMTVGTIVQPDTKLTVKGKKVPLSDLNKDIKEGDTVTLKYIKTDNLYAKQIIKK